MRREPENYFVERMENGESADLGLTNDVVFTDAGTVIKRYKRFPATSLNETVGKAVPRIAGNVAQEVDVADVAAFLGSVEENGLKDTVLDARVDTVCAFLSDATADIGYTSRADRMQMEEEWIDVLADTALKAPEIVAYGDGYIEFEQVPGENLKTYAETADPDDVYAAARTIGDAMAELHAQDYAFDDNPLNNYMIDEAGDIWSIDHEYAADTAQASDKFLDLFTIVSDARHLPEPQYRAVRDGIEAGYQKTIPAPADAAASISSPVVAKALERNDTWTRNALANTAADVRRYSDAIGDRHD